MLTVGRDIKSSSASVQLTSRTQCWTPSSCFAAVSSSRRAAAAIIAFSSGESGRALAAKPSIAGSLPSDDTSVASACTRCHAGLSTRALLLEWMSCLGPRPQRSPLDTSSHSITPLAPSVIECELVSSGERWGLGPKQDIHSSNKARVDSPAWHLVQALATLVSSDGNDPAIENFADKARPPSADEKSMIAAAAARLDETAAKKLLGVDHWVHDVSWTEALELLMSRPTVNIEGLVGGYTGPGGKTILPHKAVAKLDLRLVPDMTAAEALAALKAHLAKRGFEDIEVNMTGGYDPNSTAADAGLIRAQTAVYRRGGVDPVVLPRNAGSWPGYVFTGDPLHLPAGHFGLGHGSGAHAPNEYYVVDSKNPKVQGMAGAVRSYVDYLFELARTS